MIFDSPDDFIANIPPNSRIGALDVGTKNIGIAISDTGWNIATPKFVLRRSGGGDIPALVSKLEEFSAKGILVGLPLSMDDGDSNFTRYVRKFAQQLADATQLPIFMQDERLSSFMSESFMMDDLGISQKKTKKVVDKIAASYILQEFLDSYGGRRNG